MVKSSPQKMYRNLIVALVVTVLFGLILFVLSWVYIINVSRNQSRLDTEANSFSDEYMVLSDLKLDLARLGDNKNVVFEIIPQTKDISDFLATVETTARRDNININGVSVGDVLKKTKGGSDLSQTVSKDQYYELPIKYEVGGNYMDLTKMLSDIMSTRRLASITNLVMSADYADKVANGRVKATFVVTVYIKK